VETSFTLVMGNLLGITFLAGPDPHWAVPEE
jgi:hypothetical protein